MKANLLLFVVLAASCDGCVEDATPPPALTGEGEGDVGEGEGEGEEGEGEGEIVACDRNGCVDCDRDTFFSCLDPAFPQRPQVIDCDDEKFSVQPGGAEFWDNGVDDNCDGVVDERSSCDCTNDATPDASAYAIGACEASSTVLYGLDSQRFVTDNYYGVTAPNPGCMLAMSSGLGDPENGTLTPLMLAPPFDLSPTRSHFTPRRPGQRCASWRMAPTSSPVHHLSICRPPLRSRRACTC
jgi:Putative metal-binding motif